MTRHNLLPLILLTLSLLSVACRHDELVVPSEYDIIGDIDTDGSVRGLYLLNEGNMGANKCTLDFFDYSTGLYCRNIYAERNPEAIKELGDVGNDIGIYGSKLYIVVNCSNKVEVLNARTGTRLGQIDIPNCRYVRFHRGKAYISSYIGPVLIDPAAPKGAIFEVDTASLSITRKVTVGYQPEEMAIIDDYMYVANSGGYRAPDYDRTISVIQMIDFKQVRQIDVAINLHRICCDNRRQLWTSSRGDYKSTPSRLFVLTGNAGAGHMSVSDTINVPCTDMDIRGDSLYFIAVENSAATGTNTVKYGIVDTRSHKVISDNFITDGTETDIAVPYSITLHPENGDIFITDAKNYVSSGSLHCYSKDGRKKWSVRTGDIPAHISFLYRNKP